MSNETMSDFEVRLHDMNVEFGEIRFSDLQAITAAMQQLSTRIAGNLSGQSGLGRPPRYVQDAATLRLTGLSDGSTKLLVGFGMYGQRALDVRPSDTSEGGDEPLADLLEVTARRFWQIIEGAYDGRPPAWTTPSVAGSTVAVIKALRRAAQRVEFTRYADERRLSFRTDVDLGSWNELARQADEGIATVAGRLTLVDLDASKFRIRDDVGNRITLHEVTDADDAVGLTGQRVQATGALRRTKGGRIALADVLVSPFESLVRPPEPVHSVLVAPTPTGGIPQADLTTEEIYAMLALIDE